MGSKYGSYKFDRDTSREDKQRAHPVWRGVGFAMMILIPVMSFASVSVLLKQNERFAWIPITPDMLAVPGQFLYRIYPDPMIYVYIVIFLVCLLVFFTLFSLVSFAANSMFGVTEKKDPFYVPPVRRTTPRKRR